ncbi:MAG: AAA family ATPase, partial [Litorimonas sp.]
MLTSLSIRNVVLIESLDLDFRAGLTALTGETGAGKSIILDSLGMATGGRSDRGLVRQGTNKAQCTAAFRLETGHSVFARLGEQDIDCTPLEDITLRRTLGADGRSKAYINDTPVSIKFLNEIGNLLLEVHGQNDGRGLLDPTTHITLLDLYGSHQTELDACAQAYQTYKTVQSQLDALLALQVKAGDDRDFLTYAIAELDRLDPRADEEMQLSQMRKFLQGAEGALSELSAAQDILGQSSLEGSGEAFEDRL